MTKIDFVKTVLSTMDELQATACKCVTGEELLEAFKETHDDFIDLNDTAKIIAASKVVSSDRPLYVVSLPVIGTLITEKAGVDEMGITNITTFAELKAESSKKESVKVVTEGELEQILNEKFGERKWTLT